MRKHCSLWLGVFLALAGCDDRRAGTEVGNPEITVSAKLAVTSYGGFKAWRMYFKVMGMSYSIARPGAAPDSGKCWTRPGGTLANFATGDSVQLPDTLIRDEGTWPHAEIVLRTPDGAAGIPDTGDIFTWSNPRYARFDLELMGQFRPALFEMPQGIEYRLLFDSISVDSWRVDKEIWVPFNINADLWTDTLVYFPTYKTRVDGKGNGYVLFSPTENAAAWNALKASLPGSFYSDSVIVR